MLFYLFFLSTFFCVQHGDFCFTYFVLNVIPRKLVGTVTGVTVVRMNMWTMLWKETTFFYIWIVFSVANMMDVCML